MEFPALVFIIADAERAAPFGSSQPSVANISGAGIAAGRADVAAQPAGHGVCRAVSALVAADDGCARRPCHITGGEVVNGAGVLRASLQDLWV